MSGSPGDTGSLGSFPLMMELGLKTAARERFREVHIFRMKIYDRDAAELYAKMCTDSRKQLSLETGNPSYKAKFLSRHRQVELIQGEKDREAQRELERLEEKKKKKSSS
jgi:hypothetical protein